MSGTIALQQMKGPSRLMRKTLRHSSRSVSHTVLLIPAMPALLTRMSILPSALSVASRVFSTAARSDTSTLNAVTPVPISLAVFSANGWSRSQIATLGPEAMKRSVIARPKPCAPPVTTAQRPVRSILFMVRSFSQRPSAIDDMRDAGCKRALVAGEIDRERADFLRGAEPSHRLPADEHFAPSRTRGGGAVQHRWRFDGAGADAVAANALGDEIGGDRAGQRRHGGLGRAVDVAVGRGLEYAGGRGDVHDRAMA